MIVSINCWPSRFVHRIIRSPHTRNTVESYSTFGIELLHITSPRDCVQALTDEEHESGLEYIKRIYGARITTSEELVRDWTTQEVAA